MNSAHTDVSHCHLSAEFLAEDLFSLEYEKLLVGRAVFIF